MAPDLSGSQREDGGLRRGRDFFMAYSPEREDPGTSYAMAAIPKVLGGDGPEALRLAEALYGTFVPKNCARIVG